MKLKLFLITIVLLSPLIFPEIIFAQSVGINSTGASPDASSILDVSSTSAGMLIPRLTSAQRTAISSPAIGLIVYDSNFSTFWYFDGVNWVNLAGSRNGLTDIDNDTKVIVEESQDQDEIHFYTNGSKEMTINSSGFVGINTATPAQQLDVNGTIIGAIPQLAMAVVTENMDAADDDVMAIMITSAPSTNIIYLKSKLNKDSGSIEDLNDSTFWSASWVDFGDPSNGATGYIMDIDIDIVHRGNKNANDFGAVMTVKWSNGDIYIRNTINMTRNDSDMDDVSDWESWTLFTGPGM